MSNSHTPNFDTVARIYRWAEYVALGPLLQRTRTHFLAQLDDRQNALVLGDGDGRFLAAFLRRNALVRATAVDTSAAMLKLLRRRCSFAADRLATAQNTLLGITPSHDTDTLVTHFVLDCFSQREIDRFANHMAATTRPGTLWLLSDFGRPANKLLRPLAALYIRGLYLAFAALTGLSTRTLPDPQRALAAAGFLRLARHERLNGFLYTELWRNNAIPARVIHSTMSDLDSTHPPGDAIPDPEPAAPSLPEPDPGVYHHDITPDPLNEPKTS